MPPPTIDPAYTVAIIDDFTYLDTNRWLSGNDGSALNDAIQANLPGGWLGLPTAAAAESYRERHSPAAIFQPASRKAVVAECRLKLTEANTNQAGIFFGLTDTLTVGFLTDSSHNPPASFDGFAWFKKPGSSVWQFVISNGSNQQVLTNVGAFVSGAETELKIQLGASDGVNASAMPLLNGVNVLPSGRGVTFTVPLANLAPMRLAFGVKAGSSSAETLLVDQVAAWQTR
jgi:hypothetical protein